MIQPITPINLSSMYKPSFLGYYDPTTPNIPASVKENIQPAKDIFEKFGEQIKEGKEKLKTALTNAAEKSDGNNNIDAENSTLIHILPSGTPYVVSVDELKTNAIDFFNNESLRATVARGADSMLYGNSEETSILKQILPQDISIPDVIKSADEPITGSDSVTFIGDTEGTDFDFDQPDIADIL